MAFTAGDVGRRGRMMDYETIRILEPIRYDLYVNYLALNVHNKFRILNDI